VNKTLCACACACAASLLTLGLAACSHASAPPGAAASITGSPTAAASPATAVPVPVVTGVITATCITGVYDKTQNEFNAISGLAAGSDIAPGDVVAEAYQLNLADTSSSVTAKVSGFQVAFYADGRRLGSSTTRLARPSDIAAGKSASWTEYPWATSSSGHGPSIGPFADGNDGGVNPAATCRLVRLSR
jgi:hypothetical protein